MKNTIIPLIALSALISSCGKKTCTCTEGGAYARNVAREAGYDIEPTVYDFTVGEKAWDPDKHEMIEYTQEYIDTQIKDLEGQGYTCEWD